MVRLRQFGFCLFSSFLRVFKPRKHLVRQSQKLFRSQFAWRVFKDGATIHRSFTMSDTPIDSCLKDPFFTELLREHSMDVIVQLRARVIVAQ